MEQELGFAGGGLVEEGSEDSGLGEGWYHHQEEVVAADYLKVGFDQQV